MAKTTTLPNGWKNVKLGDIAIPITEKAGEQILETLSISAGIGFVNQAKKFGKELSGKQYVNYSVLRRGDFSFNKGNSRKYPYGCTYMLRDRNVAAVPNAFYSFKIDEQYSDYYEQLFILGYLNRQLKRLINTGVRDDGLFNLYEKDFYNCTILLPPLAEQRAIAEILFTADKLIAVKERLIAAKQKQKRWLMQNLLTGKMRLPGFSDEWEKVMLGEVCDVRDGTHDSPKYQECGIPFITSKNLSNGKIDFSNVSFISEADHKEFIRRSKVEKGDMLFGMIGTIGNVAIVTSESEFSIKNVALIKSNDVMNRHYCFYLLQSDVTMKKFDENKSSGVQQFIALTSIRNLSFQVPPLPEQTAIANILTTADREIELLTKELEQQKLIKKHLMQQLLTGKTRVKVDD